MANPSPAKLNGPKRILIIYNPSAGRFNRGHFGKVVSELDRLGCDVTIEQTTRRGDAEALAKLADPARVDAVVAAGGDGTIGEVLNGLLGRGLPLGIIPLGTANVLAAEIGLPPDPQAIASIIAAGTRLRCYPGLAEDRLFLMMAGVGFDAHVVKNTSPVLKSIAGKGAYIWATVRQLLRRPPGPYTVIVQGQSFAAASVVVGNGHFYGGRYMCTPDARLDEPVFQICLFRDGGAWATLRYIFGLLGGKLPAMANVTLLKTDHLRIEGPPGDPVQGDGDLVGALPLDIRIADITVDLLAPS